MKSNSIWKYAAVVAIAAVTGWLVAATPFTPAAQPTGYLGQLEATSFDLSGGKEIVFKTDYERTAWSGNVFAYPASAAGVINFAAEVWSGGAQVHVDGQNSDTGRIIVTRKDDGTNIPFRWTSLSPAQKTALDPASGGSSSTVLDYVRGARTNEGVSPLLYRTRRSVLGDILHSRPFYMANGGAPVLFVGANDGMLHAFDASATGGSELWAYIPSMLIGNLSALKTDPYLHTYFVDGGLNVGDAVIGGATKKVLVSGLGAGGKGMFALNVTNPIPADETAAKANILWEITNTTVNSVNDTSYANMGYTYGTPVIGKVYSGSGQSAIIMGNGYNNSGNGHSSLYIINAGTGQLIREIDTGSGSAVSPGGLSTPGCVDTGVNGLSGSPDGMIDYCFAGDVDGKLWKFDLTSTNSASWSRSLVYTTSPAQAITMAPSVSTHPSGGLMINFGTGQMFTSADVTDTTLYYAWGIWDAPAAFAANAAILTQTLTPKTYTVSGVSTRVRVTTSNAPNWAAGAANHKGWKVALPAGERIIADTVFTANGRFYFNGYNPTIDNSALTPPTPSGENWLMELDYLSGGISVNSPFLDLNGDQLLSDADRIRYVSGDTIPSGKAVGDPIATTDGIPVGKFIANGVASHPVLVTLATLNTTLFNQNPDVVIPAPPTPRGVIGGHFDVDIYFGSPTMCSYGTGTPARAPTATITVASTGNANGARLGLTGGAGITVAGVTIMNPLTTANVTDGTNTTANAATIASRINSRSGITGFSATSSSAVVTVTAPLGTSFNGGTFTFLDGTAVSGTPGSRPTGSFSVTGASATNKLISSIQCAGTNAINTNTVTSGNSGTQNNRVTSLANGLNANGRNSYSVACSTPAVSNRTNCTVSGPVGPAACGFLAIAKDTSISVTTASPTFSGGATPIAQIDNLKPRLTGSSFAGGADATLGAFRSCRYDTHHHEYDKIFDKTGVNMLNASDPSLNLVTAVPNTTTPFKVLVHNQYMNPAVTLSVGGNPHESVKTWNNQASEAVAANVVANAPTYTQATPGMTLEWNMPTTAFSARDWWGNGDVRVGLMPTGPSCLYYEPDGTHGKTLFFPVNPPNPMTASGNGTVNNTTGARHNGALTVQIIRASTPASAIELNVAGDPTFGWRVKAANFETYVLAEYNTYWHYPPQTGSICWGRTGTMGGGTINPATAGWTKAPPPDGIPTNPSVFRTPAPGSDDPATGSFRATSAVASVTTTNTTVVGNVVTIVTIGTSGTQTVTQTANANGTTTIVTVNPDGTTTTQTVSSTGVGTAVPSNVTTTTYMNGTQQTVTRTANADGTTTIVTVNPDGTSTTVTVTNSAGTVKTGGDEKGSQAKTGRVSWSELLRD